MPPLRGGDGADGPPAAARVGVDARLGAYRGGGIAQHVDRLLEGLEEIRPPERIVVLAHRRARAPRAWPFETRKVHTPPHHRLESWALPLELARARLDLLHCPDVVVPAGWRGPAVTTVHDLAFLRQPELLTPDARRYYGGVHASVRRSTRIVAVSEHTRRELLRLTSASAQRVRVVPNAVAPRFLERARPDDEAVARRYGLARPYILFVSTIEPRKNVATLLRAFRRLLDEGRHVDLALAGADGWLSGATYRVADELDLGRRALFLGYVPDGDLPPLLRQAAVLAHPALDEGFGMTPLEAMACGVPVVVSPAGALPEVVGSAGLYAVADNPADWAAGLARVLDDAALAERLRAAGRARAATFTVARQATETLAVYREAVSRRSRSRSDRSESGARS